MNIISFVEKGLLSALQLGQGIMENTKYINPAKTKRATTSKKEFHYSYLEEGHFKNRL